MKRSKMSADIILIITAGAITVLLSVRTLLKSDTSEQELKTAQHQLNKKQDEIVNLYKILGEKSNEVISLQKNIQQKSDDIIALQQKLSKVAENQLIDIQRLKNPVPENFETFFEAELDLNNNEIETIQKFSKLTGLGGNFLPTNFSSKDPNLAKVESFKDTYWRLFLTLTNENNETITIKFKSTQPMLLMGYNSNASKDVFSLTVRGDKIFFTGHFLKSENVSLSNTSISFFDFKKASVNLQYQFFYPKTWQVGNSLQQLYGMDTERMIKLKFNSFRLYTKSLNVEVLHLKPTGEANYQGSFSYSN